MGRLGRRSEQLGNYLRDLRKLMQAYSYEGSFYGHFGHACVHTRMDFDLESEEGIKKFRRFMEEAADLVVGYGGSLSGEHGDGQARAETLATQCSARNSSRHFANSRRSGIQIGR